MSETIGGAANVILVEGVSDQIAVETLAGALDRDLAALSVMVVPTNGAQGIGRGVDRFGPEGEGRRVVILCDAGEEQVVRRALDRRLVTLPVFVCDLDLEDELIRALTPARVEEVLAANDQLGSFRILQDQPAWRGQPAAAQLRRFFGSGSTRKWRYAKELVLAAVRHDCVPAPLRDVLDAATQP